MSATGESDLVYVVVESSAVGETVLGVYTSLDQARAVLPPASSGRLNDYRVEARLLNAQPDRETAYEVVVSRDGGVEFAAPAIRCACEDDDRRLLEGSYVEAGGERMRQIVWAASPGEAIAASQHYRHQLLEHDLWPTGTRRQIDSIEASPSVPAPASISA